MKTNCNVIRDLLPLVLDEAASAESKAMVDEHINECEECANYMNEMKAVLPSHATVEQSVHDAALKLRKIHQKRILRNILIGLVIGVLLVAGYSYIRNRLTTVCTQPAPLEDYEYTLSQLQDGRVILTELTNMQAMHTLFKTQQLNDQNVGTVEYYTIYYPVLCGSKTPERSASDLGFLYPEQMDQIKELRQGTPEHYVTLWRSGEDIPAASEQMEAYWAISDQLDALLYAENRSYSTEEQLQCMKLEYELVRAWYEVPEWNPEP